MGGSWFQVELMTLAQIPRLDFPCVSGSLCLDEFCAVWLPHGLMVVHSVEICGGGLSQHGMLLSLNASPFFDGLICHMVWQLVLQLGFKVVPNIKDLGS